MSNPVFDPSLVTGKPDDHERLARTIAQFVNADMSAPEDGDRDKWASDRELRALESAVVQGKSLVTDFADVCGRAEAQMRDLPSPTGDIVMAASGGILLSLGELNGLRRVEGGERNDDRIRALFYQTRGLIDAISTSPRKDRLASLWDYHAGIFAAEIGDYDNAVKAHMNSGDRARSVGDTVGAAISWFSSAVAGVQSTLVTGDDTKDDLENLCQTAGMLEEALTGAQTDPTQRRWAYLNAPIHLIVLHFLAGRHEKTMDSMVERLRQLQHLDNDLATREEAATSVCFAIVDYNAGALHRAWAIANGVVLHMAGPDPHPDYMATAHLTLARIARKRGDVDAARRQYETIATLHGAHHVKAVAARELAQMEARTTGYPS